MTQKKETKLHELLAAEGTAKSQADKCRGDLLNTFDKKRHLFGEKVTTFTPKGEGQAVQEEQSDLQTTVPQELNWLSDIWAKALDLSYMIADANTHARADVILDNGTVLMENVPATALLELEKRAGEVHALVSAIPTLDPAKGFKPDTARGAGIFVAREDRRNRTAKVQEPLVLYPATDKHPAQTQLITKDVVTGTINVQEWSGLITPAHKAEMLERAEELRRAFKTARARANEAVITQVKVGKDILQYVFGK